MSTLLDTPPLTSPPPKRTVSPLPSFLEELLADQQDLTAVERFSQFHSGTAQPLQARYYSTLLPAAPPGPGEQYAFEVDLDSCSGCKACVTACHSLNGLDENETWRDVGLLHGGTALLPVLQHVTTACHHCLDPACMNVCPTRAYEKDPVTGIVKHLDDQCFGCQYCILACPYEVPKYNAKRGIVRKCDMCSQRLAVGEAPACVQACPHEAIRIAVVKQSDVAADCEVSSFLPGAPDPQYTQPTTNYKSSRPLPRNTLPADYHAVQAEHAHWPLIIMLVLTQLSVGAFLIGELLHANLLGSSSLAHVLPIQALSALGFGILSLAAATLHLGRPLLAYRAVLGLRHSWLSREIVAFGVFATLAAVYAAVLWFGASREASDEWRVPSDERRVPESQTVDIPQPQAVIVPSPPSGTAALGGRERARVRGPSAESMPQPHSASSSGTQPSTLDTPPSISPPHPNPLPPKAGGEGTGEETDGRESEEPLTLALSPDHRSGGARRGEGAKRNLATHAWWLPLLGGGVVAVGLVGVFCSMMIYVDTQRPFWSGARTFVKFSLTTVWLGLSTVLAVSLIAAGFSESLGVRGLMADYGRWLCHGIVSVAVAKLLYEASLFRHLASKQATPLNRSARLMMGELGVWSRGRFAAGVIGGIVLPLMMLNQPADVPGATLAAFGLASFGLSLIGETLERTLFFTAAVAPRMPGALRT